MEKKEAAKVLFDQGVTQKDIALLLHVQPKTIGTWVKNGEWEKKRAQHSLARETAEEKVWKLINFNLKVLDIISTKQEEELDESADIKDLQKLLTPRGDIDALQKLFTTIKGKELEWTQIVKVIREFTEYCEQNNIELAKQVLPLANSFLNERRQDL